MSWPRRRRSNGDITSAPAAASGTSPGATAPATGEAARRGRLTKHVVFFMLIGWLVLVILVVVLISVT